jgi:hypothetical protein
LELKLYKTTDKNNKLTKQLTGETVITGTLKNKVSLINPSIILNNTNLNFNDFNYCYITEFDRYYFIDDVNITNSNLFEIKLNEDVLMSFNDDIKNMTAEITEASGANVKKLDCETSEIKTLTNSIDLKNPFSENGFLYMTTIKGA